MAEQQVGWTPLSILASGILIALAIYFRPAAAPVATPIAAPPSPVTEVQSSRQPDATEPRLAAGEPALAAPSRDIRPEAEQALAALRPILREKCWVPLVQRHPEPAQAEYGVLVAFNAQGQQMAWAVSESRDRPARSDVAQCLRQQPMTLQIPPPGRVAQARLTLQFP